MDLNSEEKSIMNNINMELNNILTSHRIKTSSKIVYNPENLKPSMKVLCESLDALNLPTFDWNHDIEDTEDQKLLLYEIVNSSLELLKLHKSTSQKLTNANCQNIWLKKNIERLNNELAVLKKEVGNKFKKINMLETEVHKKTYQLEDEKKIVNTTKVERNILQKRLYTKENELQHSKNEKKALQELHTEKLHEGLGMYRSVDKITAAKLLEYKKNEDMYRKTISKLDQNNKALMNEILDLKERFLYNNIEKEG